MTTLMRVALLAALALVLSACGEDPTVAEPDPEPDDTATADDDGAGDADDDADDDAAADDDAEEDTDADSDADADAEADDDAAEDDDADADADDDAAGNGVETVTAYFVRDTGTRLTVEPLEVTLESATQGVAAAAIEAVLAGPDVDDLSTLAPDGTELLDAELEDGLLVLDFSSELRNNPGAGGEAEQIFAEQLAHSGAQFSTVDAVSVMVDGEPIDELWGHLDWSQPLRPDPYLITPIVITQPRDGATVPAGDLEVQGHALTFEFNILVTITAPDGTVTEDFTTAGEETTGFPETDADGQEVMPRQGFVYIATLDEPGDWTIRLAESDPSDGEGRPPYEIARTVTVE